MPGLAGRIASSDREVVSCVVRSFQHLSFPTPEGGIAKVGYRIDFTP